MSLATYQRKRQFDNTPEPKGRRATKHKKLAFVVQKHQASHLHYDFRLELDGVLKSWAVPKGPSLNPEDKRLAMMVEDHPYDYRKFEGTIPAGNYGAGEVIIWDQGTYESRIETDNPQRELNHELAKGHLTFVLHGQKLAGEFALIKSPHMGENAWLLVKKHDRYAAAEDVTKLSQSVISGRKIAQAKPTPVVDVSDQPKSKLPNKLKPMLATLVSKPFDDPEWIYEIKWDGYRALLTRTGKNISLYSRSGQAFNDKYSEIIAEAGKLKGDYLIDGEIVAVDDDGKAHFEWLQNWQRQPAGQLCYFVFDIMWYNGRDLSSLPLLQRKQVLQGFAQGSSVIIYNDHIEAKGTEFFELAKRQGLEGIMAKRSASRYQSGRRSRDWLKVKTHLRQEVVVGGFTEPRGSRKHIGALVLGVYEGDRLIYAGHTGGGLPADELPELRRRLERAELKTSPFANKFKPNAPVHWVKPDLVCEVVFSEWTGGGHMRQPIFKGWRQDKPPREVHREIPDSQEQPKTTAKRPEPSSRVKFSHLDKVFWPSKGYSKGDLLTYYQAVADYILPYLLDRPHSLLRQPNGLKGQAFFQKDVEKVPDWVKTKAVFSQSNQKDIHYLVCNSLDSLLYMVQLGCIEINPWSSRTGKLDKPDWAVIDLDPEGIGFHKVIEAALVVRDICNQLGITCYPKTSGKTGIHVFIPTGAQYNYDQVKQFSQLLAGLVNQRLPKTTSVERSPSKRQHKIYVDFLQNRKGQTLAAPYSVRPTPAASVSAPLHWDEVKPGLKPTDFTIKNMPDRIKAVGDIWQPVLGEGFDMRAALARME